MAKKSLNYIAVLLFAINTISFAGFIEYETKNIVGNEWEYTYTIGDFSPNENGDYTGGNVLIDNIHFSLDK